MPLQSGEKTMKPCASFDLFGTKPASKSSVKNKISEVVAISKKSKCSTPKKNLRIHSKTTDGITFSEQSNFSSDNSAPINNMKKTCSLERSNKSEINLTKKAEEDNYNIKSKAANDKYKTSNNLIQSYKEYMKMQKKLMATNKRSDTFPKISGENGTSGIKQTDKTKESTSKKLSEISKNKCLSDVSAKKNSKTNMTMSKLPVKTPSPKEQVEGPAEELKKMSDFPKITVQSYNVIKLKKEEEEKEKVKEALKNDFVDLVPLYQKQLKKVTDVWVNAVYTSLTLRTNLVKLFNQAFPSIDKTQLQAENDRLLYCIAHAKNSTKSDAENLILFIKSLLRSQEKLKEDYISKVENKEIAGNYNYDWKDLTRKITDLGEEIKRLQTEIPEMIKQKEEIETAGNEKLRKLEHNLHKKMEDIQKVNLQLEVLKQRENSCKGNVFLNVSDYKDIKEDVLSIKATQKEYEELKAKYMCQNDTYEKKIKGLENLLEEKKNVLEREKQLKKQLQSFLDQLQVQQKQLTTTIGKEQLDYVLGRINQGRDKRLEQLLVVAVKLVLKGFLIQIKKLERDRNKMLLELHSTNSKNFNAFANTFIQKGNFIESMKHQMKTFYDKASLHGSTSNLENPSDEYQKKLSSDIFREQRGGGMKR